MKKDGKKTNRHFKVSFEIKGSMVDKDTALSDQAIQDLIEMNFALREDCKVLKIAVEEVKG
jgi:hypothetical protein